MKQVSILVFAVLAVIAFSFAPKDDKIALNVQKSSVHWVGKKPTGQHEGNLKFSAGNLMVKKGKLTGGEFTVDMTSITCTDITDPKTNQDFVGHLSNTDFFDIPNNKTATFKITKVEDKGSNNFKITGDLTIKGKKFANSFDAIVKITDGKAASATATVTVDRTKYDIKYGSKSFFDNLGDKFINDEFTLDLKMEFGK